MYSHFGSRFSFHERVDNNQYHDLPKRTETERNGPKRTFMDTRTDSLGTETDSLGTEVDWNGLLWIPKRTLWVQNRNFGC